MSKRTAEDDSPQDRKRSKNVRRVGIIGFGKVGSFLVEKVLASTKGLELAFVCDLFCPENVMNSDMVPTECKLADLKDFEKLQPDLVVEVAHPSVSDKYGVRILQCCDYMMASTTAFANPDIEAKLVEEANRPSGNGVYLTVGALYGAMDIQKMSDAGKLHSLEVTMKKHPESLFPVKDAKEHAMNETAKSTDAEVVLYEGPVRHLAAVFPVNVNTICTAAIAANKTVGMDGTIARLVADSRLEEMIIEVKAIGPPKPDGRPGLRITTLRENPSQKGEVTGQATLNSFFATLERVATAAPRGDGLHLA